MPDGDGKDKDMNIRDRKICALKWSGGRPKTPKRRGLDVGVFPLRLPVFARLQSKRTKYFLRSE